MLNLFSVFVAALVITMPVSSASAIDLAPHRALYQMKLVEANARSGITGAEGAMMYRFEETCEGWTSETKVILRLAYAEGEEVETVWSFSSWEAKDDTRFRFTVRHNRDGELIEVLQGTAERPAKGGAVTVHFTSPKNKTVEMPQGTLFPTHHLTRLIEAGQQNTLMVSEIVFDGASLDNPYQINALITTPGAKRQASAESRLIRMAFFPLQAKAEKPEFELGVIYRKNGVAEYIRQDFGSFSLDLTPNSIEVLTRPTC